MINLVKYLNQTYEDRKQKNSRYSLRSFARDLNISSGRLVTILNKRELPGKITLEKIFKHLDTPDSIKEDISKDLHRAKLNPKTQSYEKVLEPVQLEQMGKWQTWAVYTLMQREDFDGTSEWISEKSLIDHELVVQCLTNLNKIELIQKIDGLYSRKIKNVTSGTGFPSKVLREVHKQFIQRGLMAIDNVDLKMRDITGVTVCIDPEKIDQARLLISEFRSKMVTLVSSESSNSELYQLSVQFFPLVIKKDN